MGVLRAGVLIHAPLPQVWEFLIQPKHLHLWGPYTQPVTGLDRPFAAGDRITMDRKDFLRRRSQTLLVEQVVPYHSLHLRDLSPGAERLKVTAVVSVEEASDPGMTWIEEAISYSVGKNKMLQWVDRFLMTPLLQLPARYGTRRAFRRLQASLDQPQSNEQRGGGV